MTFKVCEKRKSVLEAIGHCLVTGGPGSGKTTLALVKASQRIGNGLTPGQGVLFLSFSRAAVARIVDATKGIIPVAHYSVLSIQTFHSFFWQILQGYGYLLNAPRPLSIVLAHDEKAMRDGIERESSAWAQWEVERKRLFHVEGRLCFDLFAPLTASLLSQARTIRDRIASRYPLILVDEAQDTGDEQWECIKLLAERAQVICLADPDQMIYDFLPGVGPARIDRIREALKPHEIDLGNENNRSPATEILAFARDILKGKVRGSGYKGVSRYRFQSSVENRDKAIRRSVGILAKQINNKTGVPAKSIALIASYGSGVAVISSALQQEKPIQHQVLFDEAVVLLAITAGAFLLEPKHSSNHEQDVATLLELTGAAFRAKGTKKGSSQWNQCSKYAARCRAGDVPHFKIVSAASALVESSGNREFTGDPRRDWLLVKQDFRQFGGNSFAEIASSLDYVVAFARGKRISEALSAIWMEYGAYPQAREALRVALAQEQLLSAGEELYGIHVMNTHKCKGKQFDGVVLYRQEHHSPFVWRNESAPYESSRRLLHMAITRARSHVVLLDDVYSACPITDPHPL